MNTHPLRKFLTRRHVAKPIVPWRFLGFILLVMALILYRSYHFALMGNPNF